MYNGINNVEDNNINTADKTEETAHKAEGQSLKWIVAAVFAVVIAVALVIMKNRRKNK